MDAWYYARDGQQLGPVSREELQRLIATGRAHSAEYVWTDGMADWQPANRVPGLVAAPPLAAAMPVDGPGNAPDDEPVPNYLPWAIAVTLCCCVLGGIFAIVYSVKANRAAAAGDMAEARKAADTARLWLIISAVGTLVMGFLQVMSILIRGGAAALFQ